MTAQLWSQAHLYAKQIWKGTRNGLDRTAMGLIGFVCLFALGNYLLPFTATQRLWWADGFWTLASLGAALKCLGVAHGLTGRARRVWQMFGLGCLAWFLGMLYWSYQELIQAVPAPFPAYSDAGFLVTALFFSAGLLLYREKAPSADLSLMEFSQLGIFLCCIIIIHLIFFYEPVDTRQHPGLYLLTALAYPVLYMGLMAQAGYNLWLQTLKHWRRTLVFLFAAIGLHALANSSYAYLLLGHSYYTGHYIDVMWVAGFALVYYAADDYGRPTVIAIQQHAAPLAIPRRLSVDWILPSLALLATMLVVTVRHDSLHGQLIHLLLPAIAGLVAFLVLREWSTHRVQEQGDRIIRASERRLKALTQAAPVGIFESDSRGDLVYASQHISEITGRSSADVAGEGWRQVLHPADRERVLHEWGEAVSQGKNYSTECRILRPDETVVWVLAQNMAKHDGQGDLIGYVSTLTDITDHKMTELALRDSEERFRRFFESSPVSMSISRLSDGRFIDVNAAFSRITGWPRDEAIGRTSHELGMWVEPREREQIIATFQQVGRAQDLEWRMRMRSGDIRHILGSVEIIKVNNEDCLLTAAQDVTARKHVEAEMQKLSHALAQSADAVMITDHEGIIEYVNPGFEATTGYSLQEVQGKRSNVLKSGKQGDEFYQALWNTVQAGRVFSEVFVNKKKDGSLYFEEKTITPIKDADGRITHFVATGRDISERIHTQERLRFLAHHDVLTQLPNRTMLLDRLKQSLARARWRKRMVAILFMDLDRFKPINDSLGHEVGDQLLRELGDRLTTCLREDDMVARFGGDEFVILLDGVNGLDDVRAVCDKLLNIFKTPFALSDNVLHTSASIGISVFQGNSGNAQALLKQADVAMYRAKTAGGDCYRFYSDEHVSTSTPRLTLDSELRKAWKHREFHLHYQPRFDVHAGRIVTVEALLRWQHPQRGLLEPTEFINLLEDNGLIVPVGEWVLQTACRQLAAWQQPGWNSPGMAINISGHQLEESAFAAMVKDVLAENRLPAGLLELEFSEGALLHHSGPSATTLDALHRVGVRLALDDFGSGTSSLNYLARLPIDIFKIDRGFVRQITAEKHDNAVARAIVGIGQSLDLCLVAEGVETATQRDYLLGLDCTIMQGLLFSPALTSEAMTALLDKRN